jgi:hypothetical protein
MADLGWPVAGRGHVHVKTGALVAKPGFDGVGVQSVGPDNRSCLVVYADLAEVLDVLHGDYEPVGQPAAHV